MDPWAWPWPWPFSPCPGIGPESGQGRIGHGHGHAHGGAIRRESHGTPSRGRYPRFFSTWGGVPGLGAGRGGRGGGMLTRGAGGVSTARPAGGVCAPRGGGWGGGGGGGFVAGRGGAAGGGGPEGEAPPLPRQLGARGRQRRALGAAPRALDPAAGQDVGVGPPLLADHLEGA